MQGRVTQELTTGRRPNVALQDQIIPVAPAFRIALA
jgi:hypothetical protein